MGLYNGKDLVDDLSATLSDTSSSFQTRVLRWVNEIQKDICERHDWPFLFKTGQKVLTAGSDIQDLNISAASAPTLVAGTSGSLDVSSSHEIGVTFYESTTGYESPIVNTTTVSLNASQNSVSISNIDTSGDPLVTARRLYTRKTDSSSTVTDYRRIAEISDNTTTTYSFISETTSAYTPPDFIGIRRIDGMPVIESINSQLEKKPYDQIKTIDPGSWSSGNPAYFDMVDYNRIVLYPPPSSALTLKYNYYRVPSDIFDDYDSQPVVPIWLKDVLIAGVLWKGYEYRERRKADSQKQLYEKLLEDKISTSRDENVLGVVRDVYGDVNGFET